MADDAAPPKKRQRKAPVEEQANVGAAQPKRRGRPRTSVQEPEEAAEATQVAPRQSGPRKNGLRPRVEVTGEGQTEKLPKGGKKPRLSMSAMPYDEPRHRAKPKPHPSKRPSTASVIGQNKSAKPSKQSNQKNTSRRQSVADGSVEGPEEELSDSHKATLKYRQLESRPYHVSRTVISDKWTPLDDSSIKAVSAILADTTRFVLSQYQLQGAQERYHQTHEVLNKLSSRILLKLRNGLPFPPPTHKPTGRRSEGTSHTDELNIESTVDTIEASQRTLNPLLDSIKLLEAEKRKEEAALKDDYRNLTALEANAKSEARSWKENQRKKHALVVTGHEEDGVDDEDGLKLAKPRADAQPAALFGVSSSLWRIKHTRIASDSLLQTTADDEEVVAMAHQISSHMESMRGNLQPLQDILPAMGKSKAALQTVLQKNLSAPQFERVLLG